MKRTLSYISYTLLALAGLTLAAYYWYNNTYYPSTENAYIQADVSQLSPTISGPVSQVFVSNNQFVEQDQPLYAIDKRPYVIALNKAKANIELVKQSIAAKHDAVATAQAKIEQAKAQYLLDNKNAQRLTTLVKKGRVSIAESDNASAKLAVSKASLAAAFSHHREALMLLGQEGDGNAQLKAAKTTLEKAQLDLSYTQVNAPSHGQLTNFTLHKGDVVQSGQRVASLVGLTHWWVKANFKETTLAKIKPKQQVTISVDMYPGVEYHGHVDSISRQTGSSLSVLPPENGSANWVKTTQRVPVKIIIDDLMNKPTLRVGASAYVTVNTLKS